MFEQFHRTLGTKIRLDADKIPRDLIHQEHFRSRAASARGAAQEYLRKYYHLIGTKAVELRHLRRHPERNLIAAGVQYRIHAEKPQFGTTTVAYYQTVFGLPVWEAGLAVHVRRPASKRERFCIVGAQSTRHAKIRVRKPPAKTLTRLKTLDAPTLARLLGIAGKNRADEAKSLRILRRRLMVYRFEKSKRMARRQRLTSKARKKAALDHPTLPLPPLSRRIADGRHYVVAALDFSTKSRQFGTLHWIALVETETLSVLYLRALVDHVCGLVFERSRDARRRAADERRQSRAQLAPPPGHFAGVGRAARWNALVKGREYRDLRF